MKGNSYVKNKKVLGILVPNEFYLHVTNRNSEVSTTAES